MLSTIQSDFSEQGMQKYYEKLNNETYFVHILFLPYLKAVRRCAFIHISKASRIVVQVYGRTFFF